MPAAPPLRDSGDILVTASKRPGEQSEVLLANTGELGRFPQHDAIRALFTLDIFG